MGKIIPFPKRQPIASETATHELSLEWANRRTKIKAACRCGVEFGRWAPEEGSPDVNLAKVRAAYRTHMADVSNAPECEVVQL